jgi:hypothetical protein
MAIDIDSELAELTESGDYESYDESDDESEWDEAEFIGPLLGSLPIIGPALGGLFGGSARPPLPPRPAVPSGPGVSSAVLNTPRGTATIRMPEPLVTKVEFQRHVAEERASANRVTTRLNTIQRDQQALTTRVGALATDTKRNFGRVRADLKRVRRENAAAVAKMKKDAQSQATTGMLISMMTQRQIQTSIDTHTHPVAAHAHEYAAITTGTGDTEDAATTAGQVTTPSTTNNALLILPLLLMSGDGGLGGDNMMPLVMMMAFM